MSAKRKLRRLIRQAIKLADPTWTGKPGRPATSGDQKKREYDRLRYLEKKGAVAGPFFCEEASV